MGALTGRLSSHGQPRPAYPAERDHRLRRRPARDLSGARPDDFGELRLDYQARAVSLAGRRFALTDLEYRLLAALASRAGQILTYAELLEQVWSPESGRSSGPVRTAVKNLRRKLGDDPAAPRYTFSEPRIGYCFALPGVLRPPEAKSPRSRRAPHLALPDEPAHGPAQRPIQKFSMVSSLVAPTGFEPVLPA